MRSHYVQANNLGDVFDDLQSLGPHMEEVLNTLDDETREIQREAKKVFEGAAKRNPLGMMLFAAAGGAIGGQMVKSWIGVITVGGLGLWVGSRVLAPPKPTQFNPPNPPAKNPPPAPGADDMASRLRAALDTANVQTAR